MQDERAEVNTSETNTETRHKSKEAKRAERGRMREYTDTKATKRGRREQHNTRFKLCYSFLNCDNSQILSKQTDWDEI